MMIDAKSTNCWTAIANAKDPTWQPTIHTVLSRNTKRPPTAIYVYPIAYNNSKDSEDVTLDRKGNGSWWSTANKIHNITIDDKIGVECLLVVVRIFDLLLCYQYFTAQYTILHSDAVLRQILLGFSTGKSPRRNSSTPACIPSGTSGRRRNLLYIMWSLEPLLVSIKTPPRNSKKKKRHPKTKAQSHYTFMQWRAAQTTGETNQEKREKYLQLFPQKGSASERARNARQSVPSSLNESS